MGKSMAGHLISKGYSLSIYTRTKAKAEELLNMGAQWKDIKEIAQESDFLFMMLGYPQDVEDVVFNNENGLLNHMKEGAILIDHTTSSPGQAVRIHEEALKKKIYFIDAPVSGGETGAKTGKLVSMIGGDAETVAKVKPLLECYSLEIQHMGKAGSG
jgi:3-hydroxyisobutyrate dehydrogenase